jgi:cell division protein FtsQ
VPVTAAADKRFLRAPVRPSRKRSLWRRRSLKIACALLVVGALGYAGSRGALMLARAPLLPIDRIVVKGNERLSSGEVLVLLDGLTGQSLLRADLYAWRDRLATSPWVAGAVLRKVLPSTVEVVISERRPLGVGRLGGDLYLVDDRGAIIDEYGPKYAELDLPIIDGLVPMAARGAPLVDDGRAGLAARLLKAIWMKPELAKRISQIDVSDPSDAVVLLDRDTALVRLGNERFLERLQSYVELAASLRLRVPEIDYVDLRYGERVYVGAAPGARGVSARVP